MISTHISMSAWREILARTFDGIPGQDNVSPEWLVNPATRRRLKLDKYYPDVGIAIRFVGLLAKGQGRQSDWEVQESEQRDETREELCRVNQVELVKIDPDGEDPLGTLDALLRSIARAGRTIEQSRRSPGDKAKWMTAIGEARARANTLRSQLARSTDQALASLAEAWRDRETGFAFTPVSVPARPAPSRQISLEEGQRIRHERHGPGVVTALTPDGDDTKVSILFDDPLAGTRVFLLSLLGDKVAPER